MTESRPPTLPTDDELALTALRYAAGDLTHRDAEAFAARIAEDQTARDALSEAIRLSAAALGQSPPAPDILVRDAVRDRVSPGPMSWLFPRRPYRGHPAAWAGLGGFAAAALTVFAVWLGDQPAPPRHPLMEATSPAIAHRPPEPIVPDLLSTPTVVVVHETAPGPIVIVEASESTSPLGTAVASNASESPNDNTILTADSESVSEPKATVPIEGSSAAQ